MVSNKALVFFSRLFFGLCIRKTGRDTGENVTGIIRDNSLRRGSKRGNRTSKIELSGSNRRTAVHWNLIIVIDEEDPIHWSSEPDPDWIGYRIGLERLRLPDLYHDLWTTLIRT
ncbi:hypothetical protein T12_16549 [Trichinella patagoniensis]|uniref:Uncharacterized protein n=1 Tax=Trichinella patagoniensis TaxID=990121 RepID=A0A0V0ZER4_9BILA|nr:hypothetical protein T12_16549 [Trichinella patagoniensis]